LRLARETTAVADVMLAGHQQFRTWLDAQT
jgi:hypothetical protein